MHGLIELRDCAHMKGNMIGRHAWHERIQCRPGPQLPKQHLPLALDWDLWVRPQISSQSALSPPSSKVKEHPEFHMFPSISHQALLFLLTYKTGSVQHFETWKNLLGKVLDIAYLPSDFHMLKHPTPKQHFKGGEEFLESKNRNNAQQCKLQSKLEGHVNHGDADTSL